jgi:hypothetical protein
MSDHPMRLTAARATTMIGLYWLLVLAALNESMAAGNEALATMRQPVPAQIVSVAAQDEAAQPEAIVAPKATLPALNDAELIERALARPQPQDPAASAIDKGEALQQGPGTTRLWGMSASAWEAPAFCHRPLYFEDENLERHGRSFGIFQPAVSAAHFTGRAVTWPYLAGAFPPHECIYTLGRERPGSYVPYRLYRPPVSVRGAVYEGAAIAGLSFVVP